MKLSILIPTYNRAIYLHEALDTIIPQIENGMECIISDNASTDNTTKVVREFQKHHNFIRYYKNESNLGSDRNILRCLDYATSEYVWWFSDDDRMLPGAIKKVLDVLSKHEDLSMIHVNYSSYAQDFKEKIKSRNVLEHEDKLFLTENDCMGTIGSHLSFMSSLVFQRKLYYLVDRSEEFIDSKLIPLYVILSVLGVAKKQSYLIAYPYIQQRSGNSGGYNYFECIVGEFCRVLEAVKPLGYKNASIRKTKNEIINQLVFRKVVNLRRTAPQELKGTLSILIKNFHTHLLFWAMVFPFYITPSFFVRLMWGRYKAMTKKQSNY